MLSTFKLEGSFKVTPATAAIGDTLQVTIKDFKDVTWTAGGVGVGAPKITLGGVLVNTPAVNPNSNGEATFNIDIPNGVPWGTQELKIHASSTYAANSPDQKLTISGAVVTLTPWTNLVPNQTITVIGLGFSSTSSISAAAGDASSVMFDGSANGLKTAGSDATGDDRTKINEGSSVNIDNGGNWSFSIILPINDATTTWGTHELEIKDLAGRTGTATLEIAPRVLTLAPWKSRVGTTVTVTGSGFPGDNTKTGAEATPSVSIKYTVDGTAQTVATLTPDASGNISGTFTVPLNAGIPSTNSVTAEFKYTPTGGSETTATTAAVTHQIPPVTVTVNPPEGPVGTLVSVVGTGFKTFSTLSTLRIGDIDVRPAPVPSTDSQGGFVAIVRVPWLPVGTVSVTTSVGGTAATSTYVVTPR